MFTDLHTGEQRRTGTAQAHFPCELCQVDENAHGGDKLQQKTLDLTVQAVYNYMLMSKKIQLMYLGSTAYIACLLFLRQGSKWLRA